MLDIILLKSGQILVISDEVVCKYDSWEQFMGKEGEDIDYDKLCIDLTVNIKKQPLRIGKTFVFNGIEITNPYLSECGRFDVDPNLYYGRFYKLSLED
jgi:hypothetical protein